jgi:hypothetical protein
MQTLPDDMASATPYIAYQTRTPIHIDGHLTERAWDLAPKSSRFVDVVSGAPALYETRAAVVWDANALYVGFWIEEPFIRGRQVEVAFPWAGMTWLANGRSLPPQDGDQWRLFVGRYEQLRVSGQELSVGWAWHPIGSADNHVPERFTPIQFSTVYLDDRLPAGYSAEQSS